MYVYIYIYLFIDRHIMYNDKSCRPTCQRGSWKCIDFWDKLFVKENETGISLVSDEGFKQML